MNYQARFARLLSEGRSVPLGEKFFNRRYAIDIFNFRESAILNWIRDGYDVTNHTGETPYRILQVKTIMEMEFEKT